MPKKKRNINYVKWMIKKGMGDVDILSQIHGELGLDALDSVNLLNIAKGKKIKKRNRRRN